MQNNKVKQFVSPTIIKYGVGAASEVGNILEDRFRANNILLVLDKAVQEAGNLEPVIADLKNHNIKYSKYLIDRETNSEVIDKGVEYISSQKFDIILAIGGGATIDSAKAINLIVHNKEDFYGYNHLKHGFLDWVPQKPGLPIVTIPTTAGTGSEVDSCSMIICQGTKYDLTHEYNYPKVCLADPVMTTTLPPLATGYTGLDALAQAIGAYLTTFTQPFVEPYALHSAKLIFANLRKAMQDGHNLEARENMMIASMMAGIAMDGSACTAEHKFGQTVGANYSVPHGITVGLFLPIIIEANIPKAASRIKDVGLAMGLDVESLSNEEASMKTVDALSALCKECKIGNLRSYGITENDLPELVEKNWATYEGFVTNPVHFSKEESVEIFKNALDY